MAGNELPVILAAVLLGCVYGFGRFFREIHFVDFAMKCAATDAELLGSGGYITVCRSECLSNQSFFGLMQIERAGLFTERLTW